MLWTAAIQLVSVRLYRSSFSLQYLLGTNAHSNLVHMQESVKGQIGTKTIGARCTKRIVVQVTIDQIQFLFCAFLSFWCSAISNRYAMFSSGTRFGGR